VEHGEGKGKGGKGKEGKGREGERRGRGKNGKGKGKVKSVTRGWIKGVKGERGGLKVDKGEELKIEKGKG
jgi:hypothetical protein